MFTLERLVVKFLIHRRLRTFLTTLGICIGVALVFSLISLNKGMVKAIEEQISSMGADVVTVTPKLVVGGLLGKSFSEQEVEAVKKLSVVDDATGIYYTSMPVKIKGTTYYLPVVGIKTEDAKKVFEDIKSFRIERGRYFMKGEKGKVIVGYDIWDRYKVKVGSQIEIGGKKFRVIGALAEVGNSQDDRSIYMNVEELWEMTKSKGRYLMIIAKMREMNTKPIERVLRRLRGTEDFDVLTPENMREKTSQILGIINVVFLAVASISIVVGAIGVANTMYVAVLERVREIGVMKAIGARNEQILYMFLFESGLLGLVGGLLGMALGYGIAKAFSYVARLQGLKTLKPVITPELFLISALLSFGVGIASGIFPARWASKLNPVDALRYE